jgi:hypothetical protein
MRLWVLILFLLPVVVYGQDYEVERVYSAVDSVVNRGLVRGVDIRPLIEAHVDTIVVRPPESFPEPKSDSVTRVLGLAHYIGHRNRKWVWEIRIASDLLDDFNVLEYVVAHELGHTFHVKHCCDDIECAEIMSAGVIIKPDTFWYDLQFYGPQAVLFWDKFFLQIVKNNNLKKVK